MVQFARDLASLASHCSMPSPWATWQLAKASIFVCFVQKLEPAHILFQYVHWFPTKKMEHCTAAKCHRLPKLVTWQVSAKRRPVPSPVALRNLLARGQGATGEALEKQIELCRKSAALRVSKIDSPVVEEVATCSSLFQLEEPRAWWFFSKYQRIEWTRHSKTVACDWDCERTCMEPVPSPERKKLWVFSEFLGPRILFALLWEKPQFEICRGFKQQFTSPKVHFFRFSDPFCVERCAKEIQQVAWTDKLDTAWLNSWRLFEPPVNWKICPLRWVI